jgi:5-(aminomethyl)-3-furanmethanol phosphate kinase
MNATVLKVGGSLALYPEKLKALCTELSLSSKKHRLIIVPGGGEFADVVRSLDKRFSLPCSTSNKMAILGMDQYGLLLADLTPNSVVISKLEEMEYFLGMGKLIVLLPSNLMLREDPLENSWDVTSDSIAMFIASRLNVSRVLFVTDVDGIYTDDPKKHPEAKLIAQMTARELLGLNIRTSVDKALPKLLLDSPVDSFVVNGLFPERVKAILENKITVCTVID